MLARFVRPLGSADPTWQQLVLILPGESDMWAFSWRCDTGCDLLWFYCIFTCVFLVLQMWVPADDNSPKLVELISHKPYNYIWWLNIMKRCRIWRFYFWLKDRQYRALASSERSGRFPEAKLSHLTAAASDHCPILLQWQEVLELYVSLNISITLYICNIMVALFIYLFTSMWNYYYLYLWLGINDVEFTLEEFVLEVPRTSVLEYNRLFYLLEFLFNCTYSIWPGYNTAE